MRTTRILLAALLALVAPAFAAALDAPHNTSQTQTTLVDGCQACHQLHNAIGTSLTTQVTITDACMSCHASVPGAGALHRLGFPWASGDQADLAAQTGSHHRWDATAINAGVGTTVPSDPEMAARVIAGRLECSVCHDPHISNKAFAPTSSMHTSIAVGAAVNETNAGGGSATLTLVAADSALAVARGYRIRVISAGNVAASYDGGLTWFRPTTNTGAAWVADAAVPVGGPYLTTIDLSLQDPALRVRITAGASVGDYWDFYVSFPMLRSPNLTGSLCLTCHGERAQTYAEVRTGGDGVKRFSHPVGAPLTANGLGYDRAIPLDVDGGAQGAGDTNATNDLQVGSGGVIGCTSCHAPHNADSNSLTVDPR